MDQRNSGNEGAIAALIVAVVIAMAVVKAVGCFLAELSVTLANFGKMMGSLVFMLWNTFEVVSLVAMTLFAIAGGIYFTVRFMRSVRELSENRAFLESAMNERARESQLQLLALESKMEGKLKSLSYSIAATETKLERALKKPEVAPPVAAEIKSAPAATPAERAPDALPSANPY